MSMEIKKVLLLGALSVGAFSFAGSAQADCTTDTDSQWECVEVNGVDQTGNGVQGPFEFSGTSQLDYSGISATCTLNLEGNVDVDTANNTTSITVTGGSVAGSGTCNFISVSGFPWSATATDDVYPKNTGVTVADVSGIQVNLFGSQICAGTMPDVEFGNGNPVSQPSFFDFNGSVGACTVVGTLYSQDDDVNAW